MKDVMMLVDFCKSELEPIDIRWARKQIELGRVDAIKPSRAKTPGICVSRKSQALLRTLWKKAQIVRASRKRRAIPEGIVEQAALDFGKAGATKKCEIAENTVNVVRIDGNDWLNILQPDGFLCLIRLDQIAALSTAPGLEGREVLVTLVNGRIFVIFQADSLEVANEFVASTLQLIQSEVTA